jgi:cytochrome c oxidase cbb3-type subunit III
MARTRRSPSLILLAGCAAIVASSCRREERDYRPDPPFSEAARFEKDYAQSAYALAEGKRLFAGFNCKGCHSEGGGGIGPPLMDEKWIYGFEPVQIYDTISRGQPNGMPAFGGKARDPSINVVGTLPEQQLWQLVAYVRSLSGLGSKNAAPGRSDHMQGPPPENEWSPQGSPVIAEPAK